MQARTWVCVDTLADRCNRASHDAKVASGEWIQLKRQGAQQVCRPQNLSANLAGERAIAGPRRAATAEARASRVGAAPGHHGFAQWAPGDGTGFALKGAWPSRGIRRLVRPEGVGAAPRMRPDWTGATRRAVPVLTRVRSAGMDKIQALNGPWPVARGLGARQRCWCRHSGALLVGCARKPCKPKPPT